MRHRRLRAGFTDTVNLLLLLAMVLCVASGILASRVALPYLGINPPFGPFYLRLHVLTAEVTLGLVPVHVALRRRWILAVGRRALSRGPRPEGQLAVRGTHDGDRGRDHPGRRPPEREPPALAPVQAGPIARRAAARACRPGDLTATMSDC